ncbi:hypothetical protein [Sphingomonas sp.]|uniref:tetratricopeptide repeat protein n=1 Tax=Sphingomonas sp. TaxID=28214 RepID=UPI001ECAE6B5|nr:hypothetical protein [Sphingomonas sp.]MBX3593177.1 hypothetical protein [Sphingomonas sp.]
MRAAAAAVAMVLAGGAHAESARMTGKFAAPYRDAAMLESLRVGRFSGQDGQALEMAIERALSAPDLDGRPHFDLVGGRGGDADGLLTGNVTTGVQENLYKGKEKRCVEREGGKRDGKCLREEMVEVDCTRRVINVNADFRLARRNDGRIVYTTSKPRRDEVSWCRGRNPPSTAEETIRAIILGIAAEVRTDIAPTIQNYSIRFRESTRGLERSLTRPFKEIVRQTQRDLPAACAAWQAMDGQAPDHPSIVFDLGLCAESRGEYRRALDLYRRAAALIGGGGNEGTAGIERAERLIAAREDDRERGRGKARR